MKGINRKLVAMCLLFVFGFNAMATEEEKVEFEFTADYNGKYIWRGQNLNDDPVFQPGLSATFKGLTVGIWGSMDTTDIYDSSSEFTEVDYYLDYSADVPGIEGVGFSLGVIYYDFPNTTYNPTTEIYWGLSVDTFLSPSITFYQDVYHADGLYVSGSIGHSIDLGEDAPFGIDLGASLGWGDGTFNKYYWADSVTEVPISDNAFSDLGLSAAFPFEVGGWSVTPSVNYTILLDKDIADSDWYSTDSSEFYVGIGLSKAF